MKLFRPIKLIPSSSDYKTFVETTSKVLTISGKASQKTKPNKKLLSLANLDQNLK